MNQTKKLTQGAMMLAIIGALILIDRMTAFWFTELIVLMMPIVIIMYATMHTLKDGAMLCVGLLIISFLLGNFQFTYLIYVPVGIFTGMVYAWGITKNFDRRSLMLSAIITYTIGELIATFIVYPLLGFPISRMIQEYQAAFGEASKMTGFDYKALFESIGMDMGKLIGVLYIFSTVLMGAMEGVLIHLLSIFLLKRFKIKDLGTTNIYNVKPNPPLGYLSLMAVCGSYAIKLVNNETLYYVIMILSVLGAMVLFYYGYIFLILFGAMVLKRNVGGLFILLAVLFPPLFTVLLTIGFLYATGPLRTYLENKVNQSKVNQ